MDVKAKNPDRVKGGYAAARVRWQGAPPPKVRLDELTDPQRRLVLALVEAARAENAREAK